MAKIFISYTSIDDEFATELANKFKALGHNIWFDKWNIKVGESIPAKISQGLEGSDYVIVVLTKEAVNSGWVEKEWQAAYWKEIEKRRIIVLPALLRDCEIPTLLKPKRYADFRTDFTLGFARLIEAITPADFKGEMILSNNNSINSKDVSELIARVQSKSVPLSQCIAEALIIAQKYKNQPFIQFCKRELTGWEKKDISEKDIPEKDLPSYRFVEVFCSFSKINLQYIGWGANAGNIFSHIEEHPDEFIPTKMFNTFSISFLEGKTVTDNNKSIMTWVRPLTDINPQSKTPDAKVYCYAKADISERIIESVRTELTKYLVNLLPNIK